MRTMKLIASCLIAYLPAFALANSTAAIVDARALREECSAFSQAGMRECLAKKLESSQQALRQTEEEVAGILSKWDEDNKYVSQAKAKLATSSLEFAKYRKTQCEFSASLSGGGAGNAHEMGRMACIAELNHRRAEHLRNAVSGLPLK